MKIKIKNVFQNLDLPRTLFEIAKINIFKNIF